MKELEKTINLIVAFFDFKRWNDARIIPDFSDKLPAVALNFAF
jgi:hypothetical protein